MQAWQDIKLYISERIDAIYLPLIKLLKTENDHQKHHIHIINFSE